MNGVCFAACKSIVPTDTWIPGQRFEFRDAHPICSITMYGFQVQAVGVLGYSDWSTTETVAAN